MQAWKTSVLSVGRYRPRQFEYHPQQENVVVLGTLRGEAAVVDLTSSKVISAFDQEMLAEDKHDSILGLCWLRRSPNRFIVGSSHGFLRLCDASATADAMPAPNNVPKGSVVREYDSFEKLTSVHVNCTDELALASGYSLSVSLFDLETGQQLRNFKEIHRDHINISRFANHSPFLFATSSFDRTVKMWDARVRSDNVPIYTCLSAQGHIMLTFSPDDVFLLTSAVDNGVTQYLSVDGREHLSLDIPCSGIADNFTRAYYTSSGKMILSGSSEEQTIRLHCSSTGKLIHSSDMYPGRKHRSLYIQSLRGDPHSDYLFSVLVNYRDSAHPLEIVHVNMLEGRGGENLTEHMGQAYTSRLSTDMGKMCHRSEFADVSMIASDGTRYLAHSAILGCRSPVLRMLLGPSFTSSSSSSSGEPFRLHLPEAVHPSVLPVIKQYIYTDKLDMAAQLMPDGHEQPGLRSATAASTDSRAPMCGGVIVPMIEQEPEDDVDVKAAGGGKALPAALVLYERLLQAAGALSLPRLGTLVEWECQVLVNNETVVALVSMANRQGASQLLAYCVHYLSTHLDVVTALHGPGCLTESVRSSALQLRNSCTFPIGSRNKEADDSDTEGPTCQGPTTFIPTMTGHSCSSVMHGALLVVGGGNKNQFHSCRHVLMYDPARACWTKHAARGNTPSTLIYHTATPLGPEASNKLLVFGGSNQGNFTKPGPALFVLDTLTMDWSKPEVGGEGPEQRTRHTMVALSTPSSRLGCKDASGSGRKPCFVRDARDLYLRDISGDDNLLLFGGYSPSAREAFNDVHIMNVSREGTAAKVMLGGTSTAMPQTKTGNGCCCCCWEIALTHPGQSGEDRDGLRFLWVRPVVEGTPPSPRLAHAAALLPSTTKDGDDCMVVMGGVGMGTVYNDTHVLRVGDLGTMTWDTVQVVGQEPCPRYGHSMVALPGRSELVVFGGTSGQEAYQDMFLLSIAPASASMHATTPSNEAAVVASWTQIVQSGPGPCPRSRQTMCWHQGMLLVFGGSDEMPSRSAQQPHKSREVDTGMYQLVPDHSEGARTTITRQDSDGKEEEVVALQWRWEKPDASVMDPGPEPPVMVLPMDLHVSLGSLVDSSAFSDVCINLRPPPSAAGPSHHQYSAHRSLFDPEPMGMAPSAQACSPPLFAHRVMLALRSSPLYAMLRSGMQESISSIINIQGTTTSVFLALLTYLYTDTVEDSPPEDILALLVAANAFTLEDLTAMCEGKLQAAIDIDNAATLFHYADILHLATLKIRVLTFMLREHELVEASEGFKALPDEVKLDYTTYKDTENHVSVMDINSHQSPVYSGVASWMLERSQWQHTTSYRRDFGIIMGEVRDQDSIHERTVIGDASVNRGNHKS
ncbi:unnamed protein product [Chrysoparadoxa australica]